jgi:hypothetical protein
MRRGALLPDPPHVRIEVIGQSAFFREHQYLFFRGANSDVGVWGGPTGIQSGQDE